MILRHLCIVKNALLRKSVWVPLMMICTSTSIGPIQRTRAIFIVHHAGHPSQKTTRTSKVSSFLDLHCDGNISEEWLWLTLCPANPSRLAHGTQLVALESIPP